MVDDFDDVEIPDWLRRPVTPPAAPQPAEPLRSPGVPPASGPALSESRSDELPDWFAELGIEESAAPPAAGGGAPALVMDEPAPLLDELRQQVQLQDIPAAPPRRRGGLGGVLLGLAPWQRLTLAILLFLDVVLLGCMCLVMTGRVVPFR